MKDISKDLLVWFNLPITTHLECYNYTLDLFNQNNIKFVIIRGFKYLPKRADNDLDVIIHPQSYDKFVQIYKKLHQLNLLRARKPYKYTDKNKNVYYTPIVTHYQLKDGQHLPGNGYRFDTYSDLFFYKDGEASKNRNAILLNPLFKRYLFNNKIQIDNYYIPDPISEIILLIYRNLYDKNSSWANKHKLRINELLLKIEHNEFNKICNMCFTEQQNVYQHLKNKKYHLITKPQQKLNIFIIRKKGMRKDIIDNVLSYIKKDKYHIIDMMIININNKKKFYKQFYNNFENFQENILNTNDNQCLLIITNLPKDKDPEIVKKRIRKQYIKFYPPIGNIIHSSDTTNECEKELALLLDEHIDNFRNIGTYYTSLDI